MKQFSEALVWALGYLVLVALPLVVLLVGPRAPGTGYWQDFSLALGFAGLAIMGVQFGLTARFRRASAPFGIDIIYYFHRWMAVGGLALIGAHYAILRLRHPAALEPLSPFAAPGYMTAGRVALLLFVLLVATSLWRKPLGLEYDRWRVTHTVLAVAGVVLAAVHVVGAGYYTQALWKRALWGAYLAGWVGLVAYVRIVKPWRLLGRPWRITSVRPERGRAWTLALEPVGHDGLSFSPGQFAWLTLRSSPFRAREHPFSFSGSAALMPRLEFTIKELGDFTNTIGETRVGETAWVDGPHGVFTVDRYPLAPGFVFVAGGVGIAPIMSMLRTLADRSDERPTRLVYANDHWDDVLFREEVADLEARLDLTVTHVLVHPPEVWEGERGFVTDEVLGRALPPEPARFVHFLCGPKPMGDTVQAALRRLGVPLRRIHFELFDMV